MTIEQLVRIVSEQKEDLDFDASIKVWKVKM